MSKQQKEYFLRQQLAAIQRELSNLHRGTNSKRIGGPSGNATPSELDDDEAHEAEDMADIRRKIEAMDIGSEERKTGVREWRRLKRIPQGSVEHGVIRNYVRFCEIYFQMFRSDGLQLEWLTEVPWSRATSSTSVEKLKDRAFLRNARTQLDNDHFGLEKVKRRLIEYLAVVR